MGRRGVSGPVKRSVMIAGHATSVSLEPVFWDALSRAAQEDGLPLSALVARIDAERIGEAAPANLASALRVWLFRRALIERGDESESRSQ
ncbi:ribbon-helix-helix domain-containing protein [Sphingomonas sp. XMGL2]|uniref:Ribbon-helix-helix domain-containing protein n=1 Tax=Sphingomonas quercus TaxID=2842451 RepID=A0ABS6BJ22_9SPHN|nr:ribbon-helix-helix domain-containing protein [Sphingomonas quercus]